MKRAVFIALLCILVLSSSFRCTTATWSFSILIQFQDKGQDNIDGLEVCFTPPLNFENHAIVFEKVYEHSSDNMTNFKGYMAFFFICSIRDLPSNTTYLQWDRLKIILDSQIKVSDPNDKYKEYTTTIKSLIENSEYKDRKVDDLCNENGDLYNLRLLFKIPLETVKQE